MLTSTTPPMRLPDFICIGTYKSATTWLFDCLSAHPGVFLPDMKEIHFFNVRFGRDMYAEKGVDWYASLFEPAPPSAALGDITPGYLGSPVAAARVAQTVPGVRLFALLRNPAERAWSHYCYREGRKQAQASFDEILRQGDLADETLLGDGMYARHLRRWQAQFPKSAFKVILMEDVKQDAGAVFADVCRFIGVSDQVQPPGVFARSNEAGRLRSRFLYDLNETVAKLLVTNGGDAIRRAIKATGAPAVLGRLNRVDVPNDPLRPAHRQRLEEIYRTDIEELSVLLDRDLSHWSGTQAMTGAGR